MKGYFWETDSNIYRFQINNIDGRKVKTLRKLLKEWSEVGQSWTGKGSKSLMFQKETNQKEIKSLARLMEFAVFFTNSKGRDIPWNTYAKKGV